LTSYRRALDLDRNNLTAQLGASRDLVALGNLEAAKGLLETTSAAHADNAQVHIELARVYARLGSRDLAAEQTRISQELRAREASRSGSQQ
jgi:predicted Zn-dependent protease